MASMLAALTERGDPRDVYFIHGVRDGDHHPLAAEMRTRAASGARVRVHVAYSRPRAEDRPGQDYDSIGRISLPLLERLLEGRLDADYYLCGPVSFVADLTAALSGAGVREEQISSESFGAQG